jgi:hypothetical protein
VIDETNELPVPAGQQPGRRDSDPTQTAKEAGAAAKERLGDLRDAAQSTLEDAKSMAPEKTDAMKGQAADEIARTARGLEAAAEEMEGSPLQQELLREAADGLKQISRAVQGKSIGGIVGELSDFGRQNPLAYLGGAALAGFALARFARASAPTEPTAHLTSPRRGAAPSDRTDRWGSDRMDEPAGTAAEPSSPGFAGGGENA